MKARAQYRNLFATTSFAALLATTSGAIAGTTYTSPNTNEIYNSGGLTDFISIQTTLQNDDGIDGFVISGSNNGAYTVMNSTGSIIAVSDQGLNEEGLGEYDGSLNGMHITDGGLVVNSITNAGQINVLAQRMAEVTGSETSLARDAAGIRVDGSADVEAGIYNYGLMDVKAIAGLGFESGDSKLQYVDTSASAYGVDFSGLGTSFGNSGNISVQSQSGAFASTLYGEGRYIADVEDGEEATPGETYAQARAASNAVGVHLLNPDDEFGTLVDGFDNSGGQNIQATATGTAYAGAALNIECDVSEECTAPYHATGEALAYAGVRGYGVEIGINTDDMNDEDADSTLLANSGGFYNNGLVSGVANGLLNSRADVVTDGSYAQAGGGRHDDYMYEDGSTIVTRGVGVSYGVNKFDGDFTNAGLIEGSTHTQATSFANASADYSAEAAAFDIVDTRAKGVELHADLMNGGFENSGRIAASYDVLVGSYTTEDEYVYHVPVTARARGGETANAWSNVYVEASAVGIEILGTSMTDDFVLDETSQEGDGVFATGEYNAALEADATASVSGSPSSEGHASARVSGGHHADVAGVEFNVANLSGQFINHGLVSAGNDLHVSHQAVANSVDEGYAGVDANIETEVTGIHIYSPTYDEAVISGNIFNTGRIEAHSENEFDGSARNSGVGDLYAEANGWLSASANGMEIDMQELQDNFTNYGDVYASTYVSRALLAEALADRNGSEEGTFANAVAYAGNTREGSDESYVESSSTGIDLYADAIGGHINNQGDVTSEDWSEDWVRAHAQAGDQGNAFAYAQSGSWANATGLYIETSGVGTALDYVDDVDVFDGYVANSGDIYVNVNSYSDISAEANAVDGSAVAHAQVSGSGDGNIYAYGLLYETPDGEADIAGSVVNSGSVNVRAALYSQVDANAYVDEGDSNEGVAAAMAGGENGVYAAGFVVNDFDIAATEFYGFGEEFAGFINYGDINAEADAHQSTTARATSNDGPAVAIIGDDITSDESISYQAEDPNYLTAYGTGIALGDVSIENGFFNTGGVSFVANAENNNYAKADGGTWALAEVDAWTHAGGIGMRTESLELEGSFVNSGSLYGEANAFSSNEAEADGDDAVARIKHYNGDWDVAIQTEATATGLALNVDAGFDFYNGYEDEDFSDSTIADLLWTTQGGIVGYASAASHNFANADADEGDAEAIVMQQDAARAYGMLLTQNEGSSVDFYNQGAIAGFAFAGNGIGASEDYLGYTPDIADIEDGGRQRAYAIADEGDADAHVDYAVTAAAVGADLDVSEFGNSGWIAALAVAGGSAYAHAISLNDEDTADATAEITVDATATGVRLHGSSYSDFENSGIISARASAGAHAEAEAEGSEDLNAEATARADARAFGAVLDGSGSYDTISNTEDGIISAHVEAWAWERSIYDDEESDNEGSMGSSYAQAHGLVVYAPFNLLQNDGVIEASASASDEAVAVGLALNGASNYSFSGEIVNNGTISAFASAENPYATGILVSEDGDYSLIENFGTISATVDDTSEFDLFSDYEYGPAIAIDIRDSEDGMQVSQRAGAIIGDIVMANGNLDHFDWSGGTIDGDIYGDYEQDVINIYASTVGDTTYNAYTYDGVIDGADSVSVNGGEFDDAVSVRFTNQVRNVASFNAGPNATVNLGTAASVQTDALNLNASSMLVFDINDTADTANGIINTGTANLAGTVKAQFISPWNKTTNVYRIINWDEESDTTFDHVVSSSVLTKVTAQYGEDGVDLLMQALDFGDLNYLEDDATSLGHALDRTWGDIDPYSPIGLALQDLLQLTPDQFAYELAQIAGQQTADIQHVTVAQLGSLIHVIQTQINEARTALGDNTGGDGLSFSLGSDKMKFSSQDDFKPLGNASAGDPVEQGDWRAWARVFGDWAELKASNTAPGFKSDAAGVVIGADYAPSEGLTVGLAGGYQTSDMKFGGVGKGDIDSWSATAYMDYEFGNAYVDGLVGYAAQSYDMDRYLTVLGTNYVANAKYDGGATIGAIEAGYKIALGETLTLTPFVGLNTTYTTTDGTTETGAGVWNITYDDRSDTQVDSVLGARLSKDFKTDSGMLLTPTVELGWKHGYGDTSPTAGASMASIPGSQYTIFGSETKADTAIVGAALQAQLTDTVDIYAQYNGQFSGDYSDNTASLRLRLKF